MSVGNRIELSLRQALQPLHLSLINESHQHAGPATDSHFKLVLVSEKFDGLSKLKRHQQIYKLLEQELMRNGVGGTVHALALHLFTPDEWLVVEVPSSPNCQGGHS